jgi:4-aminobutyrate aminotransferase-like enzyme
MPDIEARASLLERRRATLGPHALLFYDQPIEFVSGQGAWLFDRTGRAYLDAYNNVPHVGHAHPRVVAAISEASGRLATHTRYLHDAPVAYAERLLATLHSNLDRLIYVCTGTEANELALRLARDATGARGIIVTNASYHGNSSLLASLTTGMAMPEPFPEWARAVAVDAHFGDTVEQACNDLIKSGHGVAAFLICPVLGFEGMPKLPATAVRDAAVAVQRSGGLVIADEVQGGFGRLGDFFWSHNMRGLTPDIVTMGKPMGNGYPIGAVAAPAKFVDAFMRAGMYFNTFAGNPVACAAASAVLDVLEQENLQAKACATSAVLADALSQLTGTNGPLDDLRGVGLFQGARVRGGAAAAKQMINHAARHGVLISRTGPQDDILKIRPPMVFTPENAIHLARVLAQSQI